jgi:AraC-like DNA-binding protein
MSVRNAPASFISGSEIGQRLPFKYGVFQRDVLQFGSFLTVCDDCTIVVAATQFRGVIELNGSPVVTGHWPLGEYCSFCPGDRVAGSSELKTVVEVLRLNPGLIDKFLGDEVLAMSSALLFRRIRCRMPLLVQSIWQQLRVALDEPDPAPRTAELCVELLLVRLLEDELATSTQPASVHLPAVREAIAYINKNLGEPLDLKSIAGAAGLSAFHFSRLFRTLCGTTVYRFVLQRRLELAAHRLQHGSLSISEIALETGFSSQSHLTTAFRQKYGVTPAAFRQMTGMARSQ